MQNKTIIIIKTKNNNNSDSQRSQIELFIIRELHIITLSEMVYNVQVDIIMYTVKYMLYEEMRQAKTIFMHVNIESNNLNFRYAGYRNNYTQ